MEGRIVDKKSERYASLYCLKAVGAFFVICRHFYNVKWLFPLIQTAVPFFFIISGFFLYRDDKNAALEKGRTTLKKVIVLAMYANLFYYFAFFLPNSAFPFSDLRSFVRFLLAGDVVSGHLWYLTAYIEVLLVFIVALKSGSHRIIEIVLVFVVWGMGLLFGRYGLIFPSLPNELALSRNFLTLGIPCFYIGCLFRKYQDKVIHMTINPFCLLAVLMAFAFFEAWLLYRTYLRWGTIYHGDFLLLTIPLAAAGVLCCIKNPSLGRDTLLEKIGKTYSGDIYIYHIAVGSIIVSLQDHIAIPQPLIPVVLFPVTIGFIWVWRRLSRAVF